MSKTFAKISSVAVICAVVLGALVGPVTFAANELVSPSTTATASSEEHFTTKDSTLEFGQIQEKERSYTKALTVQNNTANDVILDVSARKYDGADEANAKMADWVAFVGGVTHFSIPKGESRDINVRVLVPADATAGTQYAYVDLVDASGYKVSVTAKINIAGDGLKYSSDVIDGWIDPVRLDNAVNGHVSVRNTGTAGFASAYQVKVKSLFGGDWEIVDEQTQDVLPSKKVEFTTKTDIGFGIYQIEQRVTFANSEGRMIESLLSRTVFNIPWWLIAVAGGLIVLIIVIIVIVKHRKKGDKLSSKKMERAEKRRREKDIERIEKAEEDAIEKEIESEDEAEEEQAAEAPEEARDDESEEIIEEEGEIEEEVEIPVRVSRPRPMPQQRPVRRAPAKKPPVKKIDIS